MNFGWSVENSDYSKREFFLIKLCFRILSISKWEKKTWLSTISPTPPYFLGFVFFISPKLFNIWA
jgi:hypothetical protein